MIGYDYETVYKRGQDHVVADALSRIVVEEGKLTTITMVTPCWAGELHASYKGDPIVTEIIEKLLISPDSTEGFSYKSGSLRYNSK